MTTEEHIREPMQEYGGASGVTADFAQQLQLLPKLLSHELFDYFCCLNYSQRRDFILDILTQMGIVYRVLRIRGAFHIIVEPEYELKQAESSDMRCFIAHYDRQPQPKMLGTNDNSIAIWHLLNLAAQMKREYPALENPMQIIFTDREGLRPRSGKEGRGGGKKEDASAAQGVCHLGQYLRQKHPELHYTFFVFDQCAVGDTLCYLPNIFAKQALLTLQDEIWQDVQQGIGLPIHRVGNYQYYFSDNLGLNLWGYPALLFSTLPLEDLQEWEGNGVKPAAWEKVYSSEDAASLLEARSFALMNQALSRLCRI